MSVLSTALVLLAVVCLLIMVILLNVATRSAHQVRSSIFPIVREEGTARMRRARVGAIVAALIAAVAAVAFFLNSQVSLPRIVLPSQMVALITQPSPTAVVEPTATTTPTPTPQVATPTAAASPTPAVQATTPKASAEPATLSPATPTLTPPATATITRAPAATFTLTPNPTHTATSTATASKGTVTLAPTISVTATTQVSTPTPTLRGSPVPAPAGVGIGPIEFSLDIDSRRVAVSPSTVFSDTVRRVYAVFPFSGMQKGLSWTQVWYFNGSELIRDQAQWQWGIQDRSYVFVNLVGAGEYRLDLYVNDEVLASGKFTVLGPTAVRGTRTP